MRQFSLAALLCLVVAESAAAAANLAFVLGGGLSAGGRLFRVVSADSGNPLGGTYTTPDGTVFHGAEFDTELDESFGFGLRIRKLLRPQWHVSGAIYATSLEITANVRSVSDNVTTVSYDELLVMSGDLSVEFDWMPRGSRPFVTAGIGVTHLNFGEREVGESLDQTKFALFAGGGYRLRKFDLADIDFEARVSVVEPDLDAEEERLTAAETFSSEGTQLLWQFNVAWVYAF